jgi:cell division protein FtsB
MRWLAAALLVVVALLQYRLWLSDHGVRELGRLKAAVAIQQAQNGRLAERNSQLAAEVRDLKNGLAALEERARSELGMIAGNETFYQVIPPKPAPAPASAPTRTASR